MVVWYFEVINMEKCKLTYLVSLAFPSFFRSAVLILHFNWTFCTTGTALVVNYNVFACWNLDMACKKKMYISCNII